MNYLTPVQKVRPDTSNLNRVAFMEALDEIQDSDVRDTILDMIDAVAELLLRAGTIKGAYAATAQATEFVAACVWKKAAAK